MSNTSKYMVIGSMVIGLVVAVAALLDIATGFPFAGKKLMDVMFLVGAGLVLYLGWDTYNEFR